MNKNKINFYIEILALTVVLLSVIALVLETETSIKENYGQIIESSKTFFALFFVSEYIIRIANTQRKGLSYKSLIKYVFSFFGLIDLLSILPVLIPFAVGPNFAIVKMVRILRVFRILKFGRYSQSVKMLGEVVYSVRSGLFSTLFLAGFTILFASACIYFLEHQTQPDAFPSILSSLWWAVCTLTTVGYGDVYPITAGGKVFSSIIAIVGIGLVAIPTGILSAAFVERIHNNQID